MAADDLLVDRDVGDAARQDAEAIRLPLPILLRVPWFPSQSLSTEVASSAHSDPVVVDIPRVHEIIKLPVVIRSQTATVNSPVKPAVRSKKKRGWVFGIVVVLGIGMAISWPWSRKSSPVLNPETTAETEPIATMPPLQPVTASSTLALEEYPDGANLVARGTPPLVRLAQDIIPVELEDNP